MVDRTAGHLMVRDFNKKKKTNKRRSINNTSGGGGVVCDGMSHYFEIYCALLFSINNCVPQGKNQWQFNCYFK